MVISKPKRDPIWVTPKDVIVEDDPWTVAIDIPEPEEEEFDPTFISIINKRDEPEPVEEPETINLKVTVPRNYPEKEEEVEEEPPAYIPFRPLEEVKQPEEEEDEEIEEPKVIIPYRPSQAV